MKDVLLLESDDYYSQRNNKINPIEACMPTSRVMWYIANKIPFDSPAGMQPEDYFMQLLNDPEAVEFCHKKYPWSADTPPNEVHGMYGTWLDEKVTGQRRSDFATNLTWDTYLEQLEAGHAVMTAGAFPKTHGHAVVVIGYRVDDDVLVLADPYGNYKSDYADEHGYGIPMGRNDFEKIITQFDGTTGKCGHVVAHAN